MHRLVVSSIAAAAALACSPSANAAEVAGYGAPFATALWHCPGTTWPSDPVVGNHPDAMVRVTFDELPDGRDWGWSIDLGEDPFVHDVTEWGGMDGDRWWWPAGTVPAGTRVVERPECYTDDAIFSTGKAEYFDRPVAPFTFSDPTVVHGGPSILGFVVRDAGEYVADITVRAARLEVYNPDREIADSPDNTGGTWEITYQPACCDPQATTTSTLALGRLSAGLHDLPFVLTDGSDLPGEDFSIRIRLRDAPATPAAPAASQEPQAPVAATPPAQAGPPAITVAGVQATVPARTLSMAQARASVRKALGARLSGWRVAAVSCKRTGTRAAKCTFSAASRTKRLRGSGTVTRRAADGAIRYRLQARMTLRGGRRDQALILVPPRR